MRAEGLVTTRIASPSLRARHIGMEKGTQSTLCRYMTLVTYGLQPSPWKSILGVDIEVR